MHRRLHILAIVFACLAGAAQAQSPSETPPAADAPPAGTRGFGSAGVLSIANDANAQFGYLNIGGTSLFTFTLLPAADYFVIDHLSVGGAIGFQVISGSNASYNNFILEPRVGYSIPLSDKLTLWPRGGLQLTTGSTSFAGLGINSATRFGIALSAPLLFHVKEHFFLGGGPSLRADLTGDPKISSLTLDFILGGWL